jgi:adenylate cyclase
MLGLAGGILGAALALTWAGRAADYNALDFLQTRLLQPVGSRVGILEVDLDATDNVGWPVPKELYAAVISVLKEAGATGVGMDVFLSDQGAARQKMPEGDDPDALIAAAAAATGATLASFVITEPSGDSSSFPPTSGPGKVRCPLTDPHSYVKPLIPALRGAEIHVGHAHLVSSKDGVYRTVVPCVPVHDGCLADLASMTAGLPLDPGTCENPVIVPYLRRYEDFRRMPMLQLIEAFMTPEGMERIAEFARDRYILIGLTDPTVGDFGPTPGAVREPLITVHANRIDSLLSGVAITDAGRYPAFLISMLLLAGGLLVFRRSSAHFAFAVAGSAACAFTCVLLFKGWHLMISPSMLILPFALGMSAAGAHAGWSFFLYSKMLRQAFESYVAPEVLEWLVKTGGSALKPDSAETREISILFSDISGFTRMSNNLGPAKILASLRLYTDRMTAIVRRHGGYTDKINGDGFVVLFGAPRKADGHATEAVACALEMQKAVVEINPEWRKMTGADLLVRIGVATGRVFVGNLGGEVHIEYTAIGRAVNLASRLEGKCPEGGVLVSRETHDELREKPAGEWITVELKGFEEEPMDAFLIRQG